MLQRNYASGQILMVVLAIFFEPCVLAQDLFIPAAEGVEKKDVGFLGGSDPLFTNKTLLAAGTAPKGGMILSTKQLEGVQRLKEMKDSLRSWRGPIAAVRRWFRSPASRQLEEDGSDGGLITKKDTDAAQQAKERREEFCTAEVLANEVDREAGTEVLVAASGGERDRVEIVKEFTTLEEEGPGPGLVASAGPIVFVFIVLTCWWYCCWTTCPCCKCCRCCAKERGEAGKLRKLVGAAIYGCIALVIIIAMSMGLAGLGGIVSGLDHFFCGVANLVDESFNGRTEEPPFVGMMPALEFMQGLRDHVEEDSPFLSELKAILKDTDDIEKASLAMTGTLNLLADMMDLPENKSPKGPSGEELYHECILCRHMAEPLRGVAEQLENGALTALGKVKEEVDKAFSGDNLESLQDTFDNGLEQIGKGKDGVRDGLGQILTDETTELKDLLAGIIALVVQLVTAIVLPALIFGCLSLFCFVTRESVSDPEQGRNKYNAAPHRLACCTFCCCILSCCLAFFMAGLLQTITYPLSGVCLVLDDIAEGNIETYADVMELKELDEEGNIKDEDQYRMTIDTINTCLSRNGDGEILNIIKTNSCPAGMLECEEEEQVKMGMKDKLDVELNGRLDAEFEKASNTTMEMKKLSEAKEFLTLIDMLKIPVDGLFTINPDLAEKLGSNPDFAAMSLDEQMLKEAWLTSAACGATEIPSTIEPLQEAVKTMGVNPIPGVNRLRELTTGGGDGRTCVAPGISCPSIAGDQAKKIACETLGNTLGAQLSWPNECSPCEAGKRMIAVKRKIREAQTYRCDLFQTASGGSCDFLEGDCVITEEDGNGKRTFRTETQKRTCTFEEFVEYVQEFSERLLIVAKRVDDTVANAQPKILGNVRDLVNKQVLKGSPEEGIDGIVTILNKMNCGFLGAAFSWSLDGLCFLSVTGMVAVAQSQLTLAIFGFILGIYMYFLFRYAGDNYMKYAEAQGKTATG